MNNGRPDTLKPPFRPSSRPRRECGAKPTKAYIPGSARRGHDKTEQESTGGSPPSGHEKPEMPCLVLFTPPKTQLHRTSARDEAKNGESVMELRVQLKICEGCGCLWYRPLAYRSVYCRECRARLREFPSPDSRKRRGRPPRGVLSRIYAVAEGAGGTL